MSEQAITSSDTTTVQATTGQLQTITVPEGLRHIARVKWFDNTLSYGFATVMSGEHAGRDIFVHQSNILTFAQGIYRTLRMGEYIEFNIEESVDSSHRYQAIAVTGPGAGQLMCESNPRRPRVQQTNNTGQQAQQNAPTAGSQTQARRQTRRNNQQQYHGGFHNQTPIQVVVEYPNPQRNQYRRPRQNRNQNNGQLASQSAAANIAATLAAGNQWANSTVELDTRKRPELLNA